MSLQKTAKLYEELREKASKGGQLKNGEIAEILHENGFGPKLSQLS